METGHECSVKSPWNKGKIVGQKAPLCKMGDPVSDPVLPGERHQRLWRQLGSELVYLQLHGMPFASQQRDWHCAFLQA